MPNPTVNPYIYDPTVIDPVSSTTQAVTAWMRQDIDNSVRAEALRELTEGLTAISNNAQARRTQARVEQLQEQLRSRLQVEAREQVLRDLRYAPPTGSDPTTRSVMFMNDLPSIVDSNGAITTGSIGTREILSPADIESLLAGFRRCDYGPEGLIKATKELIMRRINL